MPSRRQTLGASGEDVAAQALCRSGYEILGRNIRTPFGEIDLLAKDEDGVLCFVEVKTRSSNAFGHPAEAVTPDKQAHLRKAAAAILQERRWDGPCRFDVVAVTMGEDGQPVVEILPDAFQ